MQRDDAGRYIMGGVVVLAVVAAAMMFVDANAHPDLLWQGYYHDRNGHYGFGQDLALAIRSGDPVWFFAELLKAKIWPPVHGLVLAAVLLVGGIDHRLGIVPGLIGWTLTIVFVAAIARRMFRDRDPGIATAVIAVTLAVASPAFRLLACDVMLECLGAGLSAAAVWAYGRAMTPPTPDTFAQATFRWRALAIILTLLFFEKGNYWGLVVAALAVTHVMNDIVGDRRLTTAARGILRWGNVVVAARFLLDPFIIIAAMVSGVVCYLFARGPTIIVLFGHSASLYPPGNIITLAYAVLYARFALSWLKRRPVWDAALGPAGRAMLYWHVTPIAVSFLFPGRLYSFLWYVGPDNAQTGFDPLSGIALYWQAFAQGFSATPWSAVLTLGLFAIGLAHLRRFPPAAKLPSCSRWWGSSASSFTRSTRAGFSPRGYSRFGSVPAPAVRSCWSA